MILNTTGIPAYAFSVMQRIAMKGESILSVRVENIDEFERYYEPVKATVTKIIVDPENFILANDILNYVRCEVVTLGIESVVDTQEINFLNYENEYL